MTQYASKFSLKDEFGPYLEEIGRRMLDPTPLMVDISKVVYEGVMENVTSRGQGSWAPLSPFTIERWGSHAPLMRSPNSRNSSNLVEDMMRYAYKFDAGVYALGGHGNLIDSYGRSAGGGGGQGRRGRKAKAGENITHSWPAMPPRPFMYITEDVWDKAHNLASDWLFAQDFTPATKEAA